MFTHFCPYFNSHLLAIISQHTECDQRILSKRESSGNVFSPNYPFIYHQNILCRYFIYGLQDMQNLEHVRLEFEKFEMPTINEK